jgi:hypothetical protein
MRNGKRRIAHLIESGDLLNRRIVQIKNSEKIKKGEINE